MAPHAEGANGQVNGFSSAASGPKNLFTVESPNVIYTENEIKSKYTYHTTSVTDSGNGKYVAKPNETVYNFKVDRKVGKIGMMLVGWGGNNGTLSPLASLQTGVAWYGRPVKAHVVLITMGRLSWHRP